MLAIPVKLLWGEIENGNISWGEMENGNISEGRGGVIYGQCVHVTRNGKRYFLVAIENQV